MLYANDKQYTLIPLDKLFKTVKEKVWYNFRVEGAAGPGHIIKTLSLHQKWQP